MFIEPHHPGKKGWIEVICGGMFSGKTEELIRRIKRAQIANQRVEIFKSHVDARYDKDDIISHDANRIPATAVANAYNILLLGADVDVIGIDEAQFFESDIISVAEELTRQNKRVIVAGLDMDFAGNPFGPMPAFLAKAEYITKLHAICARCGDIASYSYRKARIDDKILLGEKDVYEPRCRSCFYNLKPSVLKE